MDGWDYKMGWMLVAFDLPVKEKEARKAASDFRHFLLEDGYQMMQYSVYIRPTVSYARMQTHLARLKKHVPDEGSIRAVFITEAQWQRSFVIYGDPAREQSPEEIPDQMQFW